MWDCPDCNYLNQVGHRDAVRNFGLVWISAAWLAVVLTHFYSPLFGSIPIIAITIQWLLEWRYYNRLLK